MAVTVPACRHGVDKSGREHNLDGVCVAVVKALAERERAGGDIAVAGSRHRRAIGGLPMWRVERTLPLTMNLSDT